MEKDGKIISFTDIKNQRGAQENTRNPSSIAAVREDARALLKRAQNRFDQIDEDSYASRIEGREQIAFLARFNRKVFLAAPGGQVDLRRTITDYGYDPEAAAADQSCGLDYVSEADRKEADYHRNIGTVSGLISRLETAGVRVTVGIKRVLPDEEFDDD